MHQLYPDLWQSANEHPVAEAPAAVSNAYLLVRETGNILFYSTGREALGKVVDAPDLNHMHDLGGVAWQCLAHWHEASPSVPKIRERFGARLCCHSLDASAIQQATGSEADLTFTDRTVLAGCIEAIPTPGHTSGSACYLCPSPHGKTYLFSGDTLFLENGRLQDGFIEGESALADLRRSMDLLRDLQPDVLISAAALGGPTFREFSPDEWRSEIDRVRTGLSAESDRRAS